MSNEIFEDVWAEAARKDPNGQVGDMMVHDLLLLSLL